MTTLPTPAGAAARIRAYLDATPDTHEIGAEVYGDQFRSDTWPHAAYCPTRDDLEALLTERVRLGERDAELSRLEAYGVDNWDSYEDAVNAAEL